MPLRPEALREAGNWLVQLKVILGDGTDFGGRPQSEHRSTKKAIRLVLSNLREAAGDQKGPLNEQAKRQRAEKLLFNTLDLLIDDKVAGTKKNKTRLQALEKFEAVWRREFDEQLEKKGNVDKQFKFVMLEAIEALRYEEMEKRFVAGDIPAEDMLDDRILTARFARRHDIVNAVDPTKLSGDKKTVWLNWAQGSFDEGGLSMDYMAGTEGGRMLLENDPKLRGRVIAQLDPTKLDEFLGRFPDKREVAAGALLSIAGKEAAPRGTTPDRAAQLDPAAFTVLKTQLKPAEWNDKTRGLGPQVCQALWKTKNYDQIVELIKYGVDTSVAARSPGLPDPASGIYSGFFQPIQHIVQKHLRDVPLLDRIPCPLDEEDMSRAQGAKIILKALKAAGSKTVTEWKEVETSEMIQQFKKKPGTIWGFEDVRLPFVQAAHGTKKGIQPVRMMELWEAVEQSLTPKAYEELLKNPATAADTFVEAGKKKIEAELKAGNPKYAEIAKEKDAYIRRFERQAKSFLIEFAAQMPKMAFTNTGNADPGNAEMALSDVAGIQAGKLGGGLACKAGLWWAKEERKPVYYCLDGIDMDDVINYKAVKKKAIEDFIAAKGKDGVVGHDEVITLVELREILKNWDDLKDTVKFVKKGEILKDDGIENKLTTKVQKWKTRMEAANKAAGRIPAPPRDKFARELNAIDPGLMARLADGSVGDMDARDIVKKSGYLMKVAQTRPEIVLKYIMSRCGVLRKYKLISDNLPAVAAQLASADKDEIEDLSARLLSEIKLCNAKFRGPLRDSLIRHPLVARK
jgi:hypothetical protein